MTKIILDIEGMKCERCTNNMNTAIREAFDVKQVESSHEKNQTEIITKEDISDDKLREVVEQRGFELKGITREPYEKKGLFSFLKK